MPIADGWDDKALSLGVGFGFLHGRLRTEELCQNGLEGFVFCYYFNYAK